MKMKMTGAKETGIKGSKTQNLSSPAKEEGGGGDHGATNNDRVFE